MWENRMRFFFEICNGACVSWINLTARILIAIAKTFFFWVKKIQRKEIVLLQLPFIIRWNMEMNLKLKNFCFFFSSYTSSHRSARCLDYLTSLGFVSYLSTIFFLYVKKIEWEMSENFLCGWFLLIVSDFKRTCRVLKSFLREVYGLIMVLWLELK